MKSILMVLSLLMIQSGAFASTDKGNTDVGSSDDNKLVESRYPTFLELYAECKVKSCQGFSASGESTGEDHFECNDKVIGFNAATVKIFKYSRAILEMQHKGFVSIQQAATPLQDRLNAEQMFLVDIKDGRNFLEVTKTYPAYGYRKFRINYSTKENPITTGHLEVNTEGRFDKFISLELNECQTK